MENIIKTKLDSITVKFQTKIRKNLQLFYFSKDAISYFSDYNKREFKNYEFKEFIKKFKKINFKKNTEIKQIKYSTMHTYSDELIKNELSNLIFILNISDFEGWLAEVCNLIFINDHESLLSRLGPKYTLALSEISKSNSLEDIWQNTIEKYLRNKFYEGINKLLELTLSICKIKEDKYKTIIGEIYENSLTRNLIVHNKNKVNKEYLTKSGEFKRYKNIGDKIIITENYLFEQGDNLLFFMQSMRKDLRLNK